MRRKVQWFVFLSAMMVLTTAMSSPAVADKPTAFPFGPDYIWDIDPCTGEWHELVVSGYVFLHVHPNNVVVNLERAGFTSSGYVMFSGDQQEVFRDSGFKVFLKDMWRADDGRMMEFSFKIVWNEIQGEIKLLKSELRCIKGSTVS